MNTIEITPLGELDIQIPRLCVTYDLVSCWSDNQSRAHLGRLAAAAIGVCCKEAGLPRYDIDSALPISYGGLVMDKLLSKGVTPAEVIEKGMQLLTVLAPKLTAEQEVKKK